ncbi:hypothetical protein CC1G_10258 [Coprinopsis cinerea okayama7|uniref:Endoplasmic reticulum protein n=1 Tax=Coprinopsis cinerea (strain Okayama-7 / 130 / ATCC MYA-4618 / FGSC 9003) TaxID=240176 RepID=A8N138_COPC7|nr:hypothetical protein CC1G_10258 [Coprinopsis cinerea okayama7\|eukprot:XP_001828587.2 hypothetical protein CC1G_10258 [Coprinopsis cinerea okayama7\
MATTQHYLWAGGHFVLLLSALKIFLSSVTFGSPSTWWYKLSFTGALLSYAIVCQKSLGTPQPNAAYLRRALLDENVQYFLLALYWWTSKPVTFALLPYAIFSLFHALTFARTTLMPRFLPPGPPAANGGAPTPPPLAKRLQVWVKANYDRAMSLVAYAEILILVRVLLGAITFQNSLLTPLIYAHFLKQRYYQSAFTRHALATVDKKFEELVIKRPGVPPVVGTVYERVKGVVKSWAGGVLQGGAPAAAGGNGNGR